MNSVCFPLTFSGYSNAHVLISSISTSVIFTISRQSTLDGCIFASRLGQTLEESFAASRGLEIAHGF